DSTGLRVGITGLVTDFVNVWESRENLSFFSVLDVRKTAEKELEWLKKNADVAVLCYHGGYECDIESGKVLQSNRENVAYELCRDLGYDLILTGHQHRSVPLTDICGTKTMQCPAFASAFCLVEITRDGIKGEIKAPEEKKSRGEVENKAFGDRVEEWLDKKIGTISDYLPAPDRVSSALKGNHIADFFNFIQMEATGADVSCCGLNNNLYPFPVDMTIRDILASYQYPNSLCVLEVGEKEIRAALEHSAEFFEIEDGKPVISRKFLEPKAEMYNYDYYLGISYSFDISRPKGERVTRLLFNGEEIGEKRLRMVVNNYRVTGAGGYSHYPKCTLLESYDCDVQDLAVGYFLKHKGETISWPYSDFTSAIF
ncbi:MAG: 5'-nucleotidase C-terminal domain-containing protein, partial [Candidatus Ornithospirochaeta sp.]